MKLETLEKANALKKKIDYLESIAQMLTDEYRKKNPKVHLGIARDEFSMHYLSLESSDLNDELLEDVRQHVAKEIPLLKTELEKL